jgi:betaine-aldehyde dehydrogenase
VIPFDTEEDALRIANDTFYGLAAPQSGRATSSGPCASSRACAPALFGQSHAADLCRAPWGGYKQSGIGRELGKWGVEEYLNIKQVYINLSEQPIGW